MLSFVSLVLPPLSIQIATLTRGGPPIENQL